MIVFLYPLMLFLCLLPFLWRFVVPSSKHLQAKALRVPFIKDFQKIMEKTRTNKLSSQNKFLTSRLLYLYLIWLLLVLAAARPVMLGEPYRISQNARDILLVTDISTSMLETDFSFQSMRLSRLQAVRLVVSEFVKNRPQDRIGLVLFGTRAYLQAPLTYDHQAILEVLDSMSAGMAGDSTAIGDAVGIALKTLKDTGEGLNDKIIILLTDGENNDGSINMEQALNLAKQEGAKVYTISVGSNGLSLFNSFFGIAPQTQQNGALKALADDTGGKSFQANNLNALVDVYKTIDELEPTQKDTTFSRPRTDLYWLPLLGAVVLSLLGLILMRRF